MSYMTPSTIPLEAGTYEIQMPITATINSVVHNFTNWEDLSTNPNRTIILGADKAVQANYAVAPTPMGTLKVITSPVYGDVFIDGILYGTSPVDAILSPKTCTVSFSLMQGYYPLLPVPVEVKAGQIATLLVQYIAIPPPSKGTLDIHAFSQGTEIIVNGKIVETGQAFTTPAAIEVDPGTYTIEIMFADAPYRTTKSVFGGQVTTVNIATDTQEIPLDIKWIVIPASVAALGLLLVANRGSGKK